MFITARDLSGQHMNRTVRFHSDDVRLEGTLKVLHVWGDEVILTIEDKNEPLNDGWIEDIAVDADDPVEIVESDLVYADTQPDLQPADMRDADLTSLKPTGVNHGN